MKDFNVMSFRAASFNYKTRVLKLHYRDTPDLKHFNNLIDKVELVFGISIVCYNGEDKEIKYLYLRPKNIITTGKMIIVKFYSRLDPYIDRVKNEMEENFSRIESLSDLHAFEAIYSWRDKTKYYAETNFFIKHNKLSKNITNMNYLNIKPDYTPYGVIKVIAKDISNSYINIMSHAKLIKHLLKYDIKDENKRLLAVKKIPRRMLIELLEDYPFKK